jgi:alkyldihydroxyacetonephosphate synthase
VTRARSHWAWGFVDAFPDEDARRALAMQVAFLLREDAPPLAPLPSPSDVVLAPSRIPIPKDWATFATTADDERIRHASGRAYPDLVRGFGGDFSGAPDVVAYPSTDDEIALLFRDARALGAAIVPFGGGTSVVGGVTCRRDGPVVALDLARRANLLEVDARSRLAHIEAGALGPALEAALRPHELTLRFFPQSFELSTLGGWIATRAGGHYATGATHIDELTCAVRMVTPRGTIETPRVPSSGAGMEPKRLVLGSEGTLGVITSAWMRVVPRPLFRADANVLFREIGAAFEATRRIAQSGLGPANARLLDPREALMNGVADGSRAVLVLGFESADHDCSDALARALVLATRAGGECPDGPRVRRGRTARGEGTASEAWRASFLRGPYLQSALVSLGLVVDTFETACTWDRLEPLIREVKGTLRELFGRHGRHGLVSFRFTHLYPDGPAPYFTFAVRPTQPGGELALWAEIKRVASDAVRRAGGTITHHHAVGRTHAPWWGEEVGAPFRSALDGAKRALDPDGLLNPGVLSVG